MNEKRKVRVSKFLSRILRHAPEDLGLKLDIGGWVNIDALLSAAASSGFPVTWEELEFVVGTSEKQRFAIDETETRIRANQGHSTEIDLQLEPALPPAVLYHGTPERNLAAILEGGLLKMARHHVHLSADVETATKVGERRGRAVILEIDAAKMQDNGHTFFRSANGVWLVDAVPPGYLRVQSQRTE